MTFESDHRTRIEEAVALTEELFPSNTDEFEELSLGTSAWLPLPSRRSSSKWR